MQNDKERKVRDLMIPIKDYGAISTEQSIKDAFEVLDNSGHRAVLVLDEKKKPVGILSVRDILLGLDPKYNAQRGDVSSMGESWFTRETFKDYPVFYYEGQFSGQCKAEVEKKAKEIMAPIELTIDEEAPLAEAVHVMVSGNIGRLPVRKGDEIIGMIRLMEIFNEMKKVILGH
ncbi:MAG: CBS domain-containing protein [Desulfobacterales bacterium]|nr:CBS domain-containing protein [Desulfobacterales bacterium]